MSRYSEAIVSSEEESRERDELLVPPNSNQEPVLSVVMPTLNEEEGIAECIRSVKHAIEELDITAEIIVSDDSTDRTPQIAADLGAIVVSPDKRGYGYAYQYAFQFARGEYIAMGDADTTYDFRELPKLYSLVAEAGADMALGSRLNGVIKPGSMPRLHQYVGNPVLTRFLNLFYDAGVSDAHSGFRVFSRDALQQLSLKSTGMEFASEMIMDAAAKGLTIDEVPITYHERKGEATLDSFQDGWRHVKFMLVNAPTYLFLLPAMLCTGLGLVLMVSSVEGLHPAGLSMGPNLMVAGSLLTVCGFQIGSLAIFSVIASNPIQKPKGVFSNWLLSQFRLKHGATAGLLLIASGGGLAGYMSWIQVGSGVEVATVLRYSILAFTAIVLGVEMFFSSFFFSAIAENASEGSR